MKIRAAAAWINSTPLDFEGNAARAASALDLARDKGAEFVCLPELSLSGYGCEDWFLSKNTLARSLEALKSLLPHSKSIVASVGLPFAFDGALYNVAAVMHDGRLLGLVPKQNLADDGIHYEPRWFRAWEPKRQEKVTLWGEELPFGDLTFPFGNTVLGFEICHDAWIKDRPCFTLLRRGVNLIFCPSASHFALGKMALRRGLVEAALKQGTGYVYCNLMGNEAGRAIYDGGAMLGDSRGMQGVGERFSFAEFGADVAELDLGHSEFSRAGGPPAPTEYEEFTRVLALGLYDYLRKSGAKGFTLSLSGGADSAACAILVHAASKLSGKHIPLTCVYQATANSSKATRDSAQAVAEAAGAKFMEMGVEPLVQGYKELTEKALGRKLSWDTDDLALQNLQARVRSPSVWALANAENHLLLTTANRSESSTGYATMDGDMSGSLSPLAGIGKHFLRAWLKKAEMGEAGLAALPGLSLVNALEPTAELRPAAARQTDEGDLMPYEALDAIEKLAVRDKLAPAEVLAGVAGQLKQFKRADLRAWVARFFLLWSRSQWKRERAAPSFHLDDHNVDPRTWCRFPILNSGFKAELEGLE